MDLGGKIIVITGGSRGIGAALARAFAECGAQPVVIARTEKDVDAIALETKGHAITADVRDEAACKRVMEEIRERFGRVDILINNAGVAINKPFTEHTSTEYDAIMDTNVKGVFLLTKALMPLKPHIIITISSGAGTSGYPGLSVYCASKFAVRGLMQSLAQETHAKVYTVLPGGTDTTMYQELFDEHARVKPEQVADAIVTMCQDEPQTGFELDLYKIL